MKRLCHSLVVVLAFLSFLPKQTFCRPFPNRSTVIHPQTDLLSSIPKQICHPERSEGSAFSSQCEPGITPANYGPFGYFGSIAGFLRLFT
jgi:hypothetical protein